MRIVMPAKAGIQCLGLCVASMLSACASGLVVADADPVIAGRRYVREPIPLGPLQMRLETRRQVVTARAWHTPDPALSTNPEQVDLTIGLRSARHATGMVVISGRLRYGADRRDAAVAGRVRVAGTAEGCTTEALPALVEIGLDYLFNATVGAEAWTCVTVRFQAPERAPLDPLYLTLNPISFGGELIRVLPIELAPRTE